LGDSRARSLRNYFHRVAARLLARLRKEI
jgi:hypothetical protein